MAWLQKGLLLAALLCASAWAGSYSGNPLGDLSGNAADTAHLNPSLTTGLRVAQDTVLFLPALDTAIDHVRLDSGAGIQPPYLSNNFGAMPTVAPVNSNQIAVAFIQLARGTTTFDPWVNTIQFAKVNMATGTIAMGSTMGSNQFQIVSNLFSFGYYAVVSGGPSPPNIPMNLSFEADTGGSSWASVWSSDYTPYSPLVRSHSSYTVPVTSSVFHPPMVPSGALPAAPVAGSTKSDYLKGHSMAVTQIAFTSLGGDLSELAMVFGPSWGNSASNYIHVRWEHVNQASPMIYSMDSIPVAVKGIKPLLPSHVGIASDPLKQTLVAWTDSSGTNLSMQAYSLNYSGGSVSKIGGVVALNNTIDHGSTRSDTLVPNFDLKPFGPNLFILTYAQAGAIYYRILDISGASISQGSAAQVAAGSCSVPSVAVNAKFAAFSYFVGGAGSYTPALTRLARAGNTLTAVDEKVQSWKSPTTFTTINNNFASADDYQAASLFNRGRVSVGLDTAGSVLIGFNNERDARVVAFHDRQVFYDTAYFSSKVIDLRGSGVTTALVAGDSVKFLTGVVSGTQVQNVKVSVLRNGTAQVANFASSALDAMGSWSYRIAEPRIDSFTSPLVSAVALTWNLQPRKPLLSGIRVGASASQAFTDGTRYDVANRHDTVHLYLTCWDLDNPSSLALHARTAKVVSGHASARSFVLSTYSTYANVNNDGSFIIDYVIPPLNLQADSLILNLYTSDNAPWNSPGQLVSLHYYDVMPTDSLRIQWHDGVGNLLDSGAVSGKAVHVQTNDSALVKVGLTDLNDTLLTVSWIVRNSAGTIKADSVHVHLPDTARIHLPLDPLDHNPAHIPRADSLQLKPDTLIITVRDPDTMMVQRLIFIPNHWPILDSLSAVGFVQNGVSFDSLIGRWRHGDAPPYLSVMPGIPIRLKAQGRDVDAVNGDSYSTQWQILLQDSTNRSMWTVGAVASGDSLTYSFPPNPNVQLARIAITQTDMTNAHSMDTIDVVFPRVDTVNGWSVSSNYLLDSLNFVLGSSRMSAERDFSIQNIGSVTLDVVSAHTINNDAWLSYQLVQGSLATMQSNTQTNQITTPVLIAPNSVLPIRLNIDVSKMTGDHTVYDTLIIGTNDYLTTQMRIPFVVRWEDLPTVQVYTRPHLSARSAVPTALAPYFPTNSDLLFVFSEPILTTNLASNLKVYSRLDSAARGVQGITPMESFYSPLPYSYRPYREAGKVLAGMTDTVVFTPNYVTASDHFNVIPPPESFIRADVLGLWFSNSITDTAGNALDLRRAHMLVTPGSLDSILVAKVDTSTLHVVETWPAEGTAFNPDGEIRILFSKALTTKAIFGTDTLLALDLVHLNGDSNHTVELRSRYSQNLRTDFRVLRLEQGDSVLVIQPRYRFLSDDSVTVWLAPSLASTDGQTLDGNGNGRTTWPPDTNDSYTFKFTVGAAAFYTFPNPWKASIPEHRSKGSITFKNLHELKGVSINEAIIIRIYTEDGNLVFSTKRGADSFIYDPSKNKAPLYDWNLCNNHGHPVASGVYLYTITQGSKVLMKSKLMVIR